MTDMQALEIKWVNKYDAGWAPDVLFTGFTVRAVLKRHESLITRQEELSDLRHRANREIGVEGEDWVLEVNEQEDQDEFYIQSSDQLVLWKLMDNDKFMKMFEYVEEHTTDENLLNPPEDFDDILNDEVANFEF